MNMQRRFGVLALLALLTFYVEQATAQVLPRLSGRVIVAADSTPVPNFQLLIARENNLPGAPGRHIATTDLLGYYSVLVPPGTYTLSTIDTSLYKPAKISGIKVDVGQNVVVNLAVERQQLEAVIRGHVSLAGKGVANLELFFYKITSTTTGYQGQNWDPNTAFYRDTTDAQGNFIINVLPGSYFIFVPGSNDYLPYWSAPILADRGDTTQVKIELTPRPFLKTISGKVNNLGGYRWVVVTAHSLTTGLISPDRPQADGSYQIRVPAGKYIVRCDAYLDGTLYTVYYDNVTSRTQATPVDVSTGNVTGIDFTLPPVGALTSFTIQGRVVEEGSNTPIAGAAVTFLGYNLHYGDSLASKHVVHTDNNGNYSFTGRTFFPEVSLIGSAYKDGYFIEFYDNQPTFLTATPIVVKAGETVSGIDFSLTKIVPQPGYRISGRVTGEDGQPVSCGVVIAYSTAGLKYGHTDDNGAYTIDGFPAGTAVILQAWGAPNYVPEFYDNKFSFRDADVLVMNEDKTGIDFALAKRSRQAVLGWLRGWLRPTNLPKLASNELSATVYVKKSVNSEWFAAAYIGPTGEFELPIETYGQYDVKVTARGYQDATRVVEVDENTGLFLNDLQLNLVATGVEENSSPGVIRDHRLLQAFPNPFKPVTTITVEMARPEAATLIIYNVMGQKVATLHQGLLPAGSSRFDWRGRDDAGRAVAPGLYFYRLVTASSTQTKAVVLIE